MTVEFAEKLHQYLKENLRIEVNKKSEYSYGGEYRPVHEIKLFLGDLEISSAYID